MNSTTKLHKLGQSLWLDNISRDMLKNGTLQHYCTAFSVTGLTSNPTIFEQAIGNTHAYDDSIQQKVKEGKSAEELFFELAIEDLTQAAVLFRQAFDASDGIDGWVSLEVSPLLADDADATVTQAKQLHDKAQCPNMFIKIPGTKAGLIAIEEAIFAGIPVNVTLLFSREQYNAAAEAYERGIRRRIEAGLSPAVNSVASIFVSRWDKAVAEKAPSALQNRLGIAVANGIYKAYQERLSSAEWSKLADAGAVPQRLLWASTGTKDPALSESYYIEALAAPYTVNTMPEKTLNAFAAHGELHGTMEENGAQKSADAESVLAGFQRADVDVKGLATRLQIEGKQSFEKSWHALLAVIEGKKDQLHKSPASESISGKQQEAKQ